MMQGLPLAQLFIGLDSQPAAEQAVLAKTTVAETHAEQAARFNQVYHEEMAATKHPSGERAAGSLQNRQQVATPTAPETLPGAPLLPASSEMLPGTPSLPATPQTSASAQLLEAALQQTSAQQATETARTFLSAGANNLASTPIPSPLQAGLVDEAAELAALSDEAAAEADAATSQWLGLIRQSNLTSGQLQRKAELSQYMHQVQFSDRSERAEPVLDPKLALLAANTLIDGDDNVAPQKPTSALLSEPANARGKVEQPVNLPDEARFKPEQGLTPVIDPDLQTDQPGTKADAELNVPQVAAKANNAPWTESAKQAVDAGATARLPDDARLAPEQGLTPIVDGDLQTEASAVNPQMGQQQVTAQAMTEQTTVSAKLAPQSQSRESAATDPKLTLPEQSRLMPEQGLTPIIEPIQQTDQPSVTKPTVNSADLNPQGQAVTTGASNRPDPFVRLPDTAVQPPVDELTPVEPEAGINGEMEPLLTVAQPLPTKAPAKAAQSAEVLDKVQTAQASLAALQSAADNNNRNSVTDDKATAVMAAQNAAAGATAVKPDSQSSRSATESASAQGVNAMTAQPLSTAKQSDTEQQGNPQRQFQPVKVDLVLLNSATPAQTEAESFQQQLARYESQLAGTDLSRATATTAATVAPTLSAKLQQMNLQQQDVAGQLRERVQLMVRQNIQFADIRLDPAELGMMQIRINLQQEQASVQFLVQQQHAKELLEQQMPRLREMLQQQGIQLGEGQVQQQARQQQGEAGQQARQPAMGQQSDQALESDSRQQIEVRVNERLVDYYA